MRAFSQFTLRGSSAAGPGSPAALLRASLLLLAVAALSLSGCAFGDVRLSDPLDREISLTDAQHRYTVLVRWGDIERASKYVNPEVRDEFKARQPSFRQLRFTEYESDPVEIDDDKKNATVEVVYYAYTPSSPMEVKITETQVWYRAKGVGNNWHVTPTFEGLDERMAANAR